MEIGGTGEAGRLTEERDPFSLATQAVRPRPLLDSVFDSRGMNVMKRGFIVFFFGLGGLGVSFTPLFAQETQDTLPEALTGVELPPELVPILGQAIRDHDRAREGEKGLAKKITERLEAVSPEEGGDHPVLRAYLGSAYTLRARDAWSPLNATRYANRGIRILDEAVELAPDNFTVRAVRAFNNLALPAMFGRRDRALEDMTVLVALYEKQPTPARRPATVRALRHLIEDAENKEDETTAEERRTQLARIDMR